MYHYCNTLRQTLDTILYIFNTHWIIEYTDNSYRL